MLSDDDTDMSPSSDTIQWKSPLSRPASLGAIDPVLGYKKFKVNKDNYVFFAENQRISADMRLRADDGMGVFHLGGNVHLADSRRAVTSTV